MKKHALVIGLTSAKKIAVAAFLASRSSSYKLGKTLLSTPVEELETHEADVDTLFILSKTRLPSRTILFRVVFSQKNTIGKDADGRSREAVQDEASVSRVCGPPGSQEMVVCSLTSQSTDIH